jgi:hypothetical protein
LGRQIVNVGTSLSGSVPFAPGVPAGQSGITIGGLAGSLAEGVALPPHTMTMATGTITPTTMLQIRREIEIEGNMLSPYHRATIGDDPMFRKAMPGPSGGSKTQAGNKARGSRFS